MRILILTNHFFPEEFRCNDIAFEMARRGHQVKVLTGIPDYPKGRFHYGYSYLKKRLERLKGVKIVRVPLIPRGKGGKLRMILNYGSSTVAFIFYSLYQALFHKYDCIFIHNTSPAMICLPAVLIKGIRNTPVMLWTLDLWPESLVAGGISNSKVFGVVGKMMRFIYRHCDRFAISSLGFRKKLVSEGVRDELIEYLPNWSDDSLTRGGISDMPLPELPEGFKVMFAGNLGEAQNLENVLAAALMLRHENIHWIFLGDGRKREWMERFVSENKLEDKVHLLGRFPIESMPVFFAKADAMLVSLCDEVCFNLTLPAKVQAYMSCKKPILGMLNGEGQMIIEAAGCGFSSGANDIDSFCDSVLKMASLSEGERSVLGQKGYDYYSRNFSYEKLMDQIESSLSEMIHFGSKEKGSHKSEQINYKNF